jgi:hypothetical protein
MKNPLIILLLCFAVQSVASAENLYGLELASPTMREQQRVHFVTLLKQYCVDTKSQAKAMKSLVRNKKFTPIEEHEDVFEQHYAGVSYAIAPDTESCTVDVMLARDGNKLLFSLDELITEIEKMTGFKKYQSSEVTESGIKSETVKVIKTTFRKSGSANNMLEMVYPIEHQDEFFMTLSYYYKELK